MFVCHYHFYDNEKIDEHLIITVLLLLLLLLLAAMTYNQVKSFQINDYANHYVDIEITGHRALYMYSKSIAGSGIARLISWLGTAGPVDRFNKSLPDCYIRVYRSFYFDWQGTANFWLGILLATPLNEALN